MPEIYPVDFEKKTEFYKIRKILKELCLSNAGKEKVEKMSFSADFNFIKKQLKLTEELKYIIKYKENFPAGNYFDTSEYLEKARNKVEFLSEKALFDIVRALNTVKLTVNFIKKDEENRFPELLKLTEKVKTYPYVSERINAIIDKNGQIKDNASPELKHIRNELQKKQSLVSQTVHKILKQTKETGITEKDTQITVKDGKLLIPVEARNKRKIKGIVYGESATGKTVYIEPSESVFLNNEIKELEFAELREIKKILIKTTEDLRPYFDDLTETFDFLAETDFIRAKALFADMINAENPQLTNEKKIEFLSAKHPLLYLSHKKNGKKVIPSDIFVDENKQILIISGPNAGGKSVTLKTVAVLQYMLQCGLLIPVKDISVTGIFEKIFIDIGDEQSIENDLSTYSSHLRNMKFFTENADEKTLFLIDEFGTGTEPILGGAIAEAVLERLLKSGAKGIITTHYTNLKHFADNNPKTVSAAMQYDVRNMKPLYKLEIGKPGSSFAFETAEKTGLSKDIIENAKSKTDKNQIDFEKALKQTQFEKRKLKQSKRSIRTTEIKLKETLEKYENELEKLLSEKRNILKKAEIKAEEILNSANKKIEKTIREIKRKNAEKEETKKLRKELEDYILNQKEKRKKENEKIDGKIKKLKQKKKKTEKNEAETKQKKQIKPGDYVKIAGLNTIAEVITVNKNKATVTGNNVQLTLDTDKLEKVNYKPPKKSGVNLIRTNTENTDFFGRLDVRGQRVEDALYEVSKYIDDATVKGIRHLRILHGTGNGILRNVIRDFLKSNPLVKNYKDEHIEAGGAGITVLELDI